MTDDLDAAELRRLLGPAPKLPWRVDAYSEPGEGFYDGYIFPDADPAEDTSPIGTFQPEVAAFAVAAVNALPALLARLRAAEQEDAGWENAFHKLAAPLYEMDPDCDDAALALDTVVKRMAAAEARVAALTVAGRAVMPLLYVVDGHEPGRDWCSDCGPVRPVPHTRHLDACRVAPFMAALERWGKER